MQHISWSQGCSLKSYPTLMLFLSTGVFSWGSFLIIKYYLFSEVVQYTVQNIILFITLLLHSLQFHPWQNLPTHTSSCRVFSWCLASLQLPLPEVTLFLLLTELLVALLLVSQGVKTSSLRDTLHSSMLPVIPTSGGTFGVLRCGSCHYSSYWWWPGLGQYSYSCFYPCVSNFISYRWL